MTNDILRPACRLGYPRDQVEQLLAERVDAFDHWMRGRTIAICDGREYDHETKRYNATDCGPHGAVVYGWDLDRFLMGGPILD